MKIEGYKAREFALETGIAVSTVWNWKALPKWVERYLALKARNEELEEQVRVLTKLLKET